MSRCWNSSRELKDIDRSKPDESIQNGMIVMWLGKELRGM